MIELENIESEFEHAGDETHELIEGLEDEGLNAGAVLGGAITALMFRLIICSPDAATAMGLLSSCMANAASMADEYGKDNSVHH